MQRRGGKGAAVPHNKKMFVSDETFYFVSNPYKCKVVAHFLCCLPHIIIYKKMIYTNVKVQNICNSNEKRTHRCIHCAACTTHSFRQSEYEIKKYRFFQFDAKFYYTIYGKVYK